MYTVSWKLETNDDANRGNSGDHTDYWHGTVEGSELGSDRRGQSRALGFSFRPFSLHSAGPIHESKTNVAYNPEEARVEHGKPQTSVACVGKYVHMLGKLLSSDCRST